MARSSGIRHILRVARGSRGSRAETPEPKASLQANLHVPAFGICSFAGQFKDSLFQHPTSGYGRVDLCSKIFRFVSVKRRFHATGTLRMGARELYDILGISKNAGQGEIKKAYYALAKKHHPDVNKGNPHTEKKFQQIQRVYEVLKDDGKRSLYDRVGQEGFAQAEAGGGAGGPGGGGVLVLKACLEEE